MLTKTKERPILFSGPMVLALLAGTKTQTRRLVKADVNSLSHPVLMDNEEPAYWAWSHTHVVCPYGVPGDRLWVKETFHYDNSAYVAQYKDAPWLGMPDAGNAETFYRASEKNPEIFPRWKPSIFMPRWASRITLEVTGVRVERLNDISEEDAKAEGVTIKMDAHVAAEIAGKPWTPATMEYWHLWESINGKGSWALNPWVWVITFREL